MISNKANLMLDLETLGVKPGCVILSIAAVPFNIPYDLEPFYCRIDRHSCVAEEMKEDPDTIRWWDKQDAAVRTEAFTGTTNIHVALADFDAYCKSMPTAPRIWGNGSDFDNPILAEAYKICGMKQPWSFRDNMCYRTLKNLFLEIPFTPPLHAHNALEDAKAQAAHAQKIMYWITNRSMPSE